jgi:hypothetical protein
VKQDLPPRFASLRCACILYSAFIHRGGQATIGLQPRATAAPDTTETGQYSSLVPPTGPLFELTDDPELPLRIEYRRYAAKMANNREDVMALGRLMLLVQSSSY